MQFAYLSYGVEWNIVVPNKQNELGLDTFGEQFTNCNDFLNGNEFNVLMLSLERTFKISYYWLPIHDQSIVANNIVEPWVWKV